MTTINRLPSTKARINLGQIARRAHNGNEYFILQKDGIPVIGIMAADEVEEDRLRGPALVGGDDHGRLGFLETFD